MFKYFKKQKNRRNSRDDSIEEHTNGSENNEHSKRNSLRSTSSFCDEVFLEECCSEEDAESCGRSMSVCSASVADDWLNYDEALFKYQSRLSMSLSTIIEETTCLSYFVQFLETKNALALIKFYLDTENFKTAALTHLQRSAQEESEEAHDLIEEQDKSNKAHVPELQTLCDISMHKPLTDDEKSQIYAETNKQISKCHTTHKLQGNSQWSLLSASTANTETDNEYESVSMCASAVSAASVKDAIVIYQKYLAPNAMQLISLPVCIISQLSLLLCKRRIEDAVEHDVEANESAQHSDVTNVDNLLISAHCFDEAQQYVLQRLETEYLQDFLQSAFYCRYCLELLDNAWPAQQSQHKQLHIYDILYSEVTLFYFMEYLEQMGERECLDFWSSAINFRKSFESETNVMGIADAQADAMIIYEKFFSLQTESRLWMSDRLRSCVEERICAKEHIAYCFDLPLQVTAKYLEKKYFKDFLKSQLFGNYVNELKTRLQMQDSTKNACNTLQHRLSIKLPNKSKESKMQHRKTLSDCTNASAVIQRPISQQNTLLAMQSPNLKNLTNSGSSMQIDSRQLTNPKLLWQRSNSTEGGLKFGRVNALGRYERDFDAMDNTERHNWSLALSGSKIKNAMRKLVNLPEDKVQEEIAWQVAEMIVNDVTSVTLCKQQQPQLAQQQQCNGVQQMEK